MTLHLSFPSMYKSRYKSSFENKVMGLAHQSLVSPCNSFFPFSPFLSLFFFQDDSLEHRSCIGFLCKPRKIKPVCLCLFTFLTAYAIILRVSLDPAGIQPTPVFLPGESQGRGSLVGCCLWGRTESDTTEAT